jgi:hypothetical protein
MPHTAGSIGEGSVIMAKEAAMLVHRLTTSIQLWAPPIDVTHATSPTERTVGGGCIGL